MAAVLAALLVAGLVGGGAVLIFSGGVSKDDFIEQADDICRQTLQRSQALPDPTDLESTGALFEDVTPLLEEQTRSISALEAPEEDRETLDDWLNTQRQLAEVFRTAAEAATSGDQKAFDAAFSDANLIQARSNQLASDYGFVVCGITTPS